MEVKEGERCRVARFTRYPLTSYHLESARLRRASSLFVHRKDASLCHAEKLLLLTYWNFENEIDLYQNVPSSRDNENLVLEICLLQMRGNGNGIYIMMYLK